jgi:hypothetical protein
MTTATITRHGRKTTQATLTFTMRAGGELVEVTATYFFGRVILNDVRRDSDRKDMLSGHLQVSRDVVLAEAARRFADLGPMHDFS